MNRTIKECKHTAKTASGDRAKLVILVDGARHGQDRRSGAGAPLSDPSRPLAGLGRGLLGWARPPLPEWVLGEHRYEVGDPVVSSEAGEQGDADVRPPYA